jgi:Lon protease-like protein
MIGQTLQFKPMSQALTLNALPLFPLNTVLFPGGYLPLQIFEVRYLDMVARCFKNNAPFGVISLAGGSEVRKAPTQESGESTVEQEIFHPVGTLARITSLSQPRSGLMLIQCTGLQRFAISQRNLLKHGLWVADVTLLDDDQSVPVPDDLKPVAKTLERVVNTLKAQGTSDDQMPMQQPYQYDDCAWVANRWCDVLPIPLELKHQLMALDNPLIRLELVSDMLERNGIST